MKRKMIWGLGIRIIGLVSGVSVVLLMQNRDTEPIVVYKYTEPSADNPPAAVPGYKWVWHHNHWDQVPIDNPNQPIEHHDVQIAEVPNEIEPISPETANGKPVPLNTSEGMTMYERVAASDEVPKFAVLKQMTIEELENLILESNGKEKLFGDEHSKKFDARNNVISNLTRDAKTNAEYHQILMANQDELKPFKESEQAALWNYYVHHITSSRANKVWNWLVGIERSKTPQFWVSWTLPEPFD